jgi:hypothetical protein
MEVAIAAIIAFILGVITGAVGLLALACRDMRNN